MFSSLNNNIRNTSNNISKFSTTEKTEDKFIDRKIISFENDTNVRILLCIFLMCWVFMNIYYCNSKLTTDDQLTNFDKVIAERINLLFSLAALLIVIEILTSKFYTIFIVLFLACLMLTTISIAKNNFSLFKWSYYLFISFFLLWALVSYLFIQSEPYKILIIFISIILIFGSQKTQ